MALTHAPAGTVFSAHPLGAELASARSHTLVRDAGLQIMRLVLHAGQTLAEHQVPQRLVIQCIEGLIEFETQGQRLTLGPGDLCHIPAGQAHAVHAIQAASALVFLYDHDARTARAETSS